MKVAVTGANGYIGRHVVSSLLELGHQVVAVDISIGDFIDDRAEKKKLIFLIIKLIFMKN